ncbi:uncharacterized protein EDB91DRAFT_133891 [Suillus paluster]|uniref:uncharacterized protein n=1 Tax=Suillus paluster TaxID=48578 RepID=UPI001B85F5DF|nr:uncharacterized protein EDB91DRAFT_133891 [Suillus paluster]KAG1745948.1 hypothetical protein EDB91DRAFT_133891 [Suillus paluster]
MPNLVEYPSVITCFPCSLILLVHCIECECCVTAPPDWLLIFLIDSPLACQSFSYSHVIPFLYSLYVDRVYVIPCLVMHQWCADTLNFIGFT